MSKRIVRILKAGSTGDRHAPDLLIEAHAIVTRATEEADLFLSVDGGPETTVPFIDQLQGTFALPEVAVGKHELSYRLVVPGQSERRWIIRIDVLRRDDDHGCAITETGSIPDNRTGRVVAADSR